MATFKCSGGETRICETINTYNNGMGGIGKLVKLRNYLKNKEAYRLFFFLRPEPETIFFCL